jgi:catechol 2,3-dioxygenase-like lactoylglutathione lyase family enzyme
VTAVNPSAPPFEPSNHPVALRVRDLGASSEFYGSLFGLEPATLHPVTESSVVLVSPVPGRRNFGLRLTTAPVAVRLSGVHVQLETTNELLDLYFLALLSGVPTSELRFRNGSLTMTITDPDGHTIEVETATQALPDRAAGAAARVPGRGAEPARRPGVEQPDQAAARGAPRPDVPKGLARR